uniref:LRAT domain-containing protein n=1 Tax=Anas zonorhyncha TaxID=75864 RepID=A0A8B9UAP2_9AVES
MSHQVSSMLQTLQDKVPPFLQPWHWLSSWVSSSKQAVSGVASTAAFFLCEGLLGQHFDVVPNGVVEPQPGDLFLFPLASGGPGWWGAHAGVYCGNGEIIHLEGTSGTSPTGIVAKHSKSHLLRTRGPAKVLRMKQGLDAATLQQRAQAAMDMVLEYDAVTCNCVHFALALLGLGQLTGDMVGAIIPKPRGPQYPPRLSVTGAVFSPRCPQSCSEEAGDATWETRRAEASFLGHRRDVG